MDRIGHANNKTVALDSLRNPLPNEAKDSLRACVIIPAYNVASTIARLVQEIKKQKIDVLVINDGSCDSTSSVALAAGAVVLNNNVNRGKGSSLCQGFKYAIDNGYQLVITMDGDGQHSPKDIIKFLEVQRRGSNVIIGNRMSNPKGMPLVRRITNKLMSRIISYICCQNIPDTQNGFRLITNNCLKNLSLKCQRFEIESEILIKSARAGYKINSVPIHSIYANNPSQIRPLQDTVNFIRFVFPYFLNTWQR